MIRVLLIKLVQLWHESEPSLSRYFWSWMGTAIPTTTTQWRQHHCLLWQNRKTTKDQSKERPSHITAFLQNKKLLSVNRGMRRRGRRLTPQLHRRWQTGTSQEKRINHHRFVIQRGNQTTRRRTEATMTTTTTTTTVERGKHWKIVGRGKHWSQKRKTSDVGKRWKTSPINNDNNNNDSNNHCRHLITWWIELSPTLSLESMVLVLVLVLVLVGHVILVCEVLLSGWKLFLWQEVRLNWPTGQLANLPTGQLANLPTCQLANWPTGNQAWITRHQGRMESHHHYWSLQYCLHWKSIHWMDTCWENLLGEILLGLLRIL